MTDLLCSGFRKANTVDGPVEFTHFTAGDHMNVMFLVCQPSDDLLEPTGDATRERRETLGEEKDAQWFIVVVMSKAIGVS